MTEKPIIFSAPMVRAILDGRKSMTRRIVKPQPEYRENRSLPGIYGTWAGGGWNINSAAGKKEFEATCPYGGPGDRLWVRESFRELPESESTYTVVYGADCASKLFVLPEFFGSSINGITLTNHWRPSIHMPRKYSRITLEIISVRVERVQEISEEDAIREGTETDPVEWDACYVDAFIRLWESIHGPGSWERNDWVWVIEFRRVA